MKILSVKVNNRKKTLEIDTKKGQFILPFSKLRLTPSPQNRIESIVIDKELGSEAVTYTLQSGEQDTIHFDAFLEYNRDPDYVRKLFLYKLTLIADRVVEKSRLGIREISRKLNTSPAQLYRLLDTANYAKTIDQMVRLLTSLNYDLSDLVEQISEVSDSVSGDPPANELKEDFKRGSKHKQLTNPFSTGSGGSHFEAHVQTSFVALMLTGGFAPALPCWPIKKIKLQGRFAGYDTDDLIVFVEQTGGNQKCKMLGQIKHSISIAEGDRIFGEVIQSAWNDFNNSDLFTRGRDTIALITGPLSAADNSDVRTILEWARHAEDAGEFFKKVELAKFSNQGKRNKLQAFRSQLKRANKCKAVSDKDLFCFLKDFHLLGYDLDIKSGVTLSLIQTLIGQYSQDNAQNLWSRLIDEVQTANKNAGTITLEMLPEDLQDAFKKQTVETIPSEFAVTPLTNTKRDWNQYSDASELAIVNLLGSWSENSDADVILVNQLTRKEYSSWIAKLREILQQPGSPLTLKNGIWSVTDRKELWHVLGQRIFDNNLDDFRQCVLPVLKEHAPRFDLPPEDRYAASIHGKIMKHSYELRKGLAETLALLGNHSNALSHCSLNKSENVAALTVRKVLENADWVLWGSLNELLIPLAEATPNEFLTAVETSLQQNPCPFDELFSQEGDGITGTNYLTGLLWALETLAWDEEFLVRVSVILGELASHDPGGKWANRPSNSLATIFLPWFPQTMASVEKRKVAVQTLRREIPEITWKLLLGLLPNQYQMSMGSHKPKWRKLIPEDWTKGVTQKEYWDQVSFYASLAVEMAKENGDWLNELIGHMKSLPHPSLENLLEYLSSEDVLNKPESERLELWNGLIGIASKHKRFADAKWALSSHIVLQIENIAKGLAPSNPLNRHRMLFSGRDFDLIEEIGNWQEQHQKLEKRREQAIEDIMTYGGIDAVLEFAEKVKSPWNVGYSLGLIAKPRIDAKILPSFLENESSKLQQLSSGFVSSRHRSQGWEWVDKIDTTHWSHSQIGQFLAYLPFQGETWNRVSTLLSKSEGEYWNRTNVNPYDVSNDLEIAIDKLIKYGRPKAAIDCLNRLLQDKRPLNKTQAVQALLSAIASKETTHSMDAYSMVEVIKALRIDPNLSKDDLFRIEWAYLPLLNEHYGASPKFLEYRLASEAEFFCEVIRLIYRSKKEPKRDKEPTEEQRAIATNAYWLLDQWRTPPGLKPDGSFSKDHFGQWLNSVKSACTDSGHLEVALTCVGNVLIYSPPDPGGLWINRTVAEALNAKDAEEMRNGFYIELHNSRGVHWIDPTGRPERELAAKYRQQASDVEDAGYYRLAATLRDLAESYDREAERIILENKAETSDG